MAVAKANDARVFQKTPDNGFDANVLGQPFDTGAQRANAAHHQADLHTRLDAA